MGIGKLTIALFSLAVMAAAQLPRAVTVHPVSMALNWPTAAEGRTAFGLDTRVVQSGFANTAAAQAVTPAYIGQLFLTDEKVLLVATTTTAGHLAPVMQVAEGTTYLLQDVQINGNNLSLNEGTITAASMDGSTHAFSVAAGAVYTDNVMRLQRPDDGAYCAIAYDIAGAEWAALGAGTPTSHVALRNRAFWEAGKASASANNDVRKMEIHQYAIHSATLYRYPRVILGDTGDFSIYGLAAGSGVDGSGDPTSPIALRITAAGQTGIGTASPTSLAGAGGKVVHLYSATDFPSFAIERAGARRWDLGLGDGTDSYAFLIHNATGSANVVVLHGSAPNSINVLSSGVASFAVGAAVKAGTSSSAAKVGGTLVANVTAVGNVGSGEDDLISYTVPASTLDTNGHSVRFTTPVAFAANGNNKTVKVYWNGSSVYSTTAVAANATAIEVVTIITRTGAATQNVTVRIVSGDSLIADHTVFTTGAGTLSGGVIFKLTGEATSNDDIIQKQLIGEFIPAP